MKLYTLEYSFNKPMQLTITVGTNTDYMIGISAVKNGELINLQPQDVTLTIGENVLTSEKLINGYVVFDYSLGRKPVSEIVKVTILDTQFELLVVGKFSSKGDIGVSGGVTEETDPVFVEKCLSADSITLGKDAIESDYSIAIGEAAGSSLGYESVAIGRFASAKTWSVSIGMNSKNQNGTNTVAIGTNSKTLSDNTIAIGNSANADGESSIVIGNGANSNDASIIAIGYNATVISERGIAIGSESQSSYNAIAIGPSSHAETNTIQLGTGGNYNTNTLQVWDHTLLNKETGLIPPERLGTGYDSSQRQVLVNNFGTLTWETYNG